MAARLQLVKRPSMVARGWHTALEYRRRMATISAAALALALGYHVIFGQNGLTVYGEKRESTVTLAREIDALERENGLLKAHVERLQTDPAAIEHQAREELHYTRPGEVIYTLPSQRTK